VNSRGSSRKEILLMETNEKHKGATRGNQAILEMLILEGCTVLKEVFPKINCYRSS